MLIELITKDFVSDVSVEGEYSPEKEDCAPDNGSDRNCRPWCNPCNPCSPDSLCYPENGWVGKILTQGKNKCIYCGKKFHWSFNKKISPQRQDVGVSELFTVFI